MSEVRDCGAFFSFGAAKETREMCSMLLARARQVSEHENMSKIKI